MMIKKISAVVLAVMISAGMVCMTTAFAADENAVAATAQEYAADKDAGEQLVQNVLDKKDEIIKDMQSFDIDPDVSFSYSAWFQDLDLDGTPEFIMGGRVGDGSRHFYILDKDGKVNHLEGNSGVHDHIDGPEGFAYELCRNIYTGEFLYMMQGDVVRKMTFSADKGVTEEELCKTTYDEKTNSDVYTVGGKQVNKTQYGVFLSTISSYVPVDVTTTVIYQYEFAAAGKDELLKAYNDYTYSVPTKETGKADMIRNVKDAYDLLDEDLGDLSVEMSPDVEWDYEGWFEDIDFDGVPEFLIGGAADYEDGTSKRVFMAIDSSEYSYITDNRVSSDHGKGAESFGYKPYKNKTTGEYALLTADSYADKDTENYAVRRLVYAVGKYMETDLCTAQKDKTSGKTTYTVEGSEVSEEDFQKYLSSLNSTYEELSVNIESTGGKTILTDEIVLSSSYDAYKLGDVVGGASFTYEEKQNTSNDISIPDKTAGSQASKNYNTDSSTNPSTGAAAGVTAAIIAAGAGLAICAKRKKK